MPWWSPTAAVVAQSASVPLRTPARLTKTLRLSQIIQEFRRWLVARDQQTAGVGRGDLLGGAIVKRTRRCNESQWEAIQKRTTTR